jgi:signal transduction histidine kinase
VPVWAAARIPAAIGLMSVLPVLSNRLMVLGLPPGPQTMPETTALRLMPVLLMALILTAWRYRWRHVLLYSLGIALFSMALHLFRGRPGGPSLLPPATVLVIQTVSFTLVGSFISTLMARLERQRAALAGANARLAQQASTLEQLTISRERNRMARELHDTLAHTLSALSVQLETAEAYWEVDSTTSRELLGRSLRATRSGLQETRRALKALRASPLEDLGLVLALRRLAEEGAARANLALDLALPERPPALSPDAQQCLYRVAQEALANAIHHANARTLVVHLLADDGAVTLTVADDGQGFDIAGRQDGGRYGLRGMRERAERARARLTIDSRPGQGTTVRLTMGGTEDASHHLR